MRYFIENENLKVGVDSLGAELYSVQQGGKEWIWQNSSGNWAGHAPVLFPVCGATRCTVGGVQYDMPRHGLARKAEFALLKQEKNYLQFSFQSNEQTKKAYPFDFQFFVGYKLEKSKLVIEWTVENTGNTPLWFACGGHESFQIEKPLNDYAIEFEKQEHLLHLYHSKVGLTDKTFDFGHGNFLPIPVELLRTDDSAIFSNLQSKKVWLCEKNGKRLAEISFDGAFSNLVIWRCENDPFICIEPWTTLPDPEFKPDVEFATKKGVVQVDAGEKITLVRTVEYL